MNEKLLTDIVPAFVPSLFHNSRPFAPRLVQKRSVPFTFTSPKRPEPFGPITISLTSTVPAAVPSLFHNSQTPVGTPLATYNNVKNNVPFTFKGFERDAQPESP